MDFDELMDKAALKGRRTFRRAPFPGVEDVEVALRLLTDAEMDSCRERTATLCKRKNIDNALDPDYFDRILTREIIARAFYDADTIDSDEPHVLFGSNDRVAELDPIIIRQLFAYYDEHMREADPLLFLGEDEARAFVEAMGKERGLAMLSSFDAATLMSLCLTLGALLQKSQSPNSSGS